jgi:hypothetical protein
MKARAPPVQVARSLFALKYPATVRGFFMHQGENMLTVNDVAARWNADPKFVYGLIAVGALSVVRLGAPGAKRPMIRVPLASLEQYERAQSNGGQA